MTKEFLKEFCTRFFIWWYNQPSPNTMQGYDTWIKTDEAKSIATLHGVDLDNLDNQLAGDSYKALDDNSLMPFGRYSMPPDGPLTMANVPADYLLWLYDNNKCNYEVKKYIENSLQALRNEQAKQKSFYKHD